MIRKLYLLALSLTLSIGYTFGQAGLGSIQGSVIDKDSKEPIAFVKVIISQGGIIKGGAETDFDGKFQFPSVSAGAYDIEFRSPEHQPKKIESVGVSAERITFLNSTEIGKPDDVKELEEVQVIAYKVPLINRDGGAAGLTITREDIAKLPVRSAQGVAATVGGVNESESSGGLSVRGSREDASYYFIDGIKVRGSANIPKSALEEVTVITGGLPANYGDATGGIISVTTRGPSAQYFGSFEGVSSGFYLKGADPLGYDGKVIGLDNFGYNLLEGMFSGPLIMKKDSTGKKTEPLIGFLISGTFNDNLDPRPTAEGGWRVSEEARKYLLKNPLRPSASGEGNFNNANFLTLDGTLPLTNDDGTPVLDDNGKQIDVPYFERTPWRMNSRRSTVSASGKIDVNTGPRANLTFGGQLNYDYGKSYSYSNSLFNFENFGSNNALDWRVYGRWTQRFINDREGSSSKVKSFYYNIMVDYSQSKRNSFDERHGYNIFNYGHVGTYETTRRPTYGFNTNGDSLIHNGFQDVEVAFTPSTTNTSLAAITSQYYDIYANQPQGRYENLTQILQGNALRNGDTPNSIYSLWGALGTPFNGFSRSEAEQFRITGSGSVVIGGHSISLGFEYEQRWDRGWGSGNRGPIGIWEVSRQYMNNHITELDANSPTYDFFGTFPRVTYDRLNAGSAHQSGTGAYGGAINGDEQFFFDYNFREYLLSQGIGSGGAGSEFIDIDNYDPSIFKLDWFSPDELFNQGQNFVSYFGYDHTGRRVKGNTDINGYFNDIDDNGNYTRFIGAFQPVYIAGYIMDKFAFDDIVFNVGLRMDIFDANQPVLKDPYLFFNSRTASEARALAASDPGIDQWVNIPGNIGDDYIVYVNDVDNPTQINGFRNGETWFNANGDVIEDPSTLRGAAGIAPWLLEPGQERPSGDAFERYKPSVNFMPRIAFSFPISDEAMFFANYDVLTKRPTTGLRFDPIDYQFIRDRNVIINNADLRPERTIDYAFGFQQVLSRTSSLKINAFYRELRDQVQVRNLFEAYPATYRTYGNRDFGTVKGITFEYDLRRTGNVRINANYTLQFADGTGSDPNSALSFVNGNQPDLRFIYPFNYDQRHAFAFTVDYRYGKGKDYNGPRIKDFNIFENTGLNIITLVNSGTPYSRQNNITPSAQGIGTPQLIGALNGSRQPWTYRLDLQLDRTIDLEYGKEDNKKRAFLNVYVRVTNMFNQFNVLNVYRATGNPDDDGYLAASQSQATIQNQLDEQSFRDMYRMAVDNPFNISIPRTIRLGVKFDF